MSAVLGFHRYTCHTTTHSHDHHAMHVSAVHQSDHMSVVAVLCTPVVHMVAVVTEALVLQLLVFVMSSDHHTPTYRHTHTETDRHIHTQTHRDRQTYIHTHIETHTDRQTYTHTHTDRQTDRHRYTHT